MAKTTGKQVSWYATGSLQYECSFPMGEINCQRCDFCRTENSGQRCRCMITSEILYAPSKDIGLNCPLTIHYPEGHEPLVLNNEEE